MTALTIWVLVTLTWTGILIHFAELDDTDARPDWADIELKKPVKKKRKIT